MIKCKNKCPLGRFDGCCRNCPEWGEAGENCPESCVEHPNECGEAIFNEETGLQAFQKSQLATLNAIASLTAHKKAIEEQEKTMKAALYDATTTDYLFDLAEFEVFGTRYYANTYEQNYQLQYDYYKAGNSKVAYKHSAVSTAVWWGLRSPIYNYYNTFMIVWTDGAYANGYAHSSGGLRPGFAA